jgi:hypothetical protein
MTVLSDLLVEAGYEGVFMLDGFDDAFIGVGERCGQEPLPIYSWEKMVEVLIARDGMDYEDAVEFISYNCLGAWLGEKTPIIMLPVEGN